MLDNHTRGSSFGIHTGSTAGTSSRGVRFRSIGVVPVLAIVVAVLSVASRASAGPPPDTAAGEQTYKTNCVLCHGADGTGSATGKTLKAPDLHSDAVQKMTPAQMEAQISDGRNNMPPFKSTLTKDQIAAVAAYVRATFGKKK